MKNVLLIDPVYNPGNIPPNLGLGRIENYLKTYPISVTVADFVIPGNRTMSLRAFKDIENDFIHRATEAAQRMDAVYISGSHGMEMKPYAIFPRIIDISHKIKKLNPNIPIIFGGALANYYLQVMRMNAAIFKELGLDEVVTGQEVNSASFILVRLGYSFPGSTWDAATGRAVSL